MLVINAGFNPEGVCSKFTEKLSLTRNNVNKINLPHLNLPTTDFYFNKFLESILTLDEKEFLSISIENKLTKALESYDPARLKYKEGYSDLIQVLNLYQKEQEIVINTPVYSLNVPAELVNFFNLLARLVNTVGKSYFPDLLNKKIIINVSSKFELEDLPFNVVDYLKGYFKFIGMSKSKNATLNANEFKINVVNSIEYDTISIEKMASSLIEQTNF